MRFERFVHNHTLISEHNATKSNFKLGVNHLTDRTGAEYIAMLGFIPPEKHEDL